MLDPGAIGTVIIWRETEARSEAEIERGTPPARRTRPQLSTVAHNLARTFRALADRLEPSTEGQSA